MLLAVHCSPRENAIRFCESFTEANEMVGEDTQFSPGTISMLLELTTQLPHREVRVQVYRIVDGEHQSYGRQVIYALAPRFLIHRFDDAISIADTGRFIVHISDPTARLLAEGSLHIVSPQ